MSPSSSELPLPRRRDRALASAGATATPSPWSFRAIVIPENVNMKAPKKQTPRRRSTPPVAHVNVSIF
jgi:hypothetical protein